MLAHRPQYSFPAIRSFPVATLVAVALSVTACGGDNPMAPMDQETSADQPASLDVTGALLTTQRLVFTSNRNGQYDIYKMDPAGQNVVRLTTSQREGIKVLRISAAFAEPASLGGLLDRFAPRP